MHELGTMDSTADDPIHYLPNRFDNDTVQKMNGIRNSFEPIDLNPRIDHTYTARPKKKIIFIFILQITLQWIHLINSSISKNVCRIRTDFPSRNNEE